MGANSSKQRALHAAAQAGDASLLRQLLQPLVAAAVAEMSIEGAYPGPAAALLGHAVNRRDRRGRSALLIACMYGSWECAELLLEAGSSIIAVDADGNGCLHLASIKGHGHVVGQVRRRQSVPWCMWLTITHALNAHPRLRWAADT
jgi:hypothetical protein